MSSNNQKFRPLLTGEQIGYILSYCTSQSDQIARSIIKTLIPFHAKIQSGIATPAYIATPVKSLEEQMGFDTSPEPTEKELEELNSLQAILLTQLPPVPPTK